MSEQHHAAPSEAILRRKMTARPASPMSAIQFNAKDALYAATAVAIISGFNIAGTSIPLFSILVIILCALDRNSFAARTSSVFLVPPLIIFSAIHLGTAFRGGINNGAFFLAQFIIIFAFIWLFVIRYSTIEMSRFNRFFSILAISLLAYVIWWHVSKGQLVSWKRLPDPKAIFSLLPLMIVLTMRSRSALLRQISPALLLTFAAIIFLSGERKAYILLLLFLPLFIRLRSPATYIVPVVALLLIPAAVSLDPTGYLKRQVATIEGFAGGRVVSTASNEGRSAALRITSQIIAEHPIFGVGTHGQYAAAYEFDRNVVAPHNEWVRVAAENGVIGLFFYAATVLWGLVGAVRTRVMGRYRSRAEKEAALALVAVLIMYISLEAFDFIVLLAFLLIPFIQYLRLMPQSPAPAVFRPAEGRTIRRPDLRPAPR
jgi:O-antigen ligase